MFFYFHTPPHNYSDPTIGLLRTKLDVNHYVSCFNYLLQVWQQLCDCWILTSHYGLHLFMYQDGDEFSSFS